MKKKFKKTYSEYNYLLFVFLYATSLVVLFYLILGITPFGKNSLLQVDFYHQYGPFLAELYDRVHNLNSLIYSFNSGLGVPFFKNFLNYLSSPFNVILFLFKRENILMAFSFIIGLKAVASAMTMSFYLKNKVSKQKLLIIPISLLYAFSSYFVAYHWNLMWLDGIVLLPLIVYGIEKIVDTGKIKFYVITLFIMLFSNYFIAYMICIFSCIYFLYYYFLKNKYNLYLFYKSFMRFVMGSLLAAGLGAVFLLPLYIGIDSISATHDLFPKGLTLNFSMLNFLFNNIAGVTPTVFVSEALPLPNIATGVITIILLSLFFFNEKIKPKEKILTAVLFLVFIFSFYIKSLDFIWHGFHVPNDLPYRYSFIYIFLMLVIAYKSLINIKYLKIENVFMVFIMNFILVIFAKKQNFVNMGTISFIVNIVYILLYFILYLLYKYKVFSKLCVSFFLIVMCVIEISVYTIPNLDNGAIANDFTKDYISYNKSVKLSNNTFRTEKFDYKTLNDASWYNYKGMSTFSSMAYKDMASLQRKLGNGGNNINSYYYKSQTPIYNSIMGIKYLMGAKNSNKYYNHFKKQDNVNVYEYNYPLSIAFYVNKNLKNWDYTSINPFEVQEDFFIKAANQGEIFNNIYLHNIKEAGVVDNISGSSMDILFNNEEDKEINLLFKGEKEGQAYFYFYNPNIDYIIINEKVYYFTPDESYIIDYKNIEQEEDINIKIVFKNEEITYLDFYAYTINEENFIKGYNTLKNNNINLTKESDTKLYARVSNKRKRTVFTSIPYDKGWKVTINNKKITTYKIANAFLMFDLPEGNYDLKFKYIPLGLYFGIFISLSSLTISILLMLNRRKNKKNN